MIEYDIRYDNNPHQGEFSQDLETKYLHMSSGFGGGKSFAIAMKTLELSQLNYGIPGGIVVPSLADFKKDLLPIFEDILDENGIPYRYHKSDKWFQFPWSPARAYVASAENKIRGPNWGWAVINEVTLISQRRYRETIGRVRIKNTPYPQIASSGTPEGTDHWMYDMFIENPPPLFGNKCRVIYGDTRDNRKHLADDYIESLEASFDEVMLDAYLRGLWVNMHSSRFYYSYDPVRNHDLKIERIPEQRVHVSLDYNVDPMCATLWHLLPVSVNGMPVFNTDRSRLYRLLGFDQIEISGPKGADTNKMCDAMYARGLDPRYTTIYPDPAGRNRSTQGPPDNEILKQRGFHDIKVRLVAPRFRKRQLAANALLEKSLVTVHPLNCKGIVRDWSAVEQDKATYEKLKTNPKLTHYSDGFDYMVDILFPLMGSPPESGSIKIR